MLANLAIRARQGCQGDLDGSHCAGERVTRLLESVEEAEREDLREWLALDGSERIAVGEPHSREEHGAGESRLELVVEVADLPRD